MLKKAIITINSILLLTSCGGKDDEIVEKSFIVTSTESATTNKVHAENSKGDENGILKNGSSGSSQIYTKDYQELTQTFVGKSLVMIYPHSRNWGYISIVDQDAKEIYENLNIEEYTDEASENIVWNPSSSKEGKHISCFKQSQKDTPEEFDYACNVYFDYSTGEVNYQNLYSVFVKSSEELKGISHSYQSESLSLTAKDSRFVGKFTLNNDDSKKLYYTMDFDSYHNKKISPHFTCSVKNDFYSCHFRFNFLSGVIDSNFIY